MVNLNACRAKAVNAITSDTGVQEHVEEVPLAANDVAVTEPERISTSSTSMIRHQTLRRAHESFLFFNKHLN